MNYPCLRLRRAGLLAAAAFFLSSDVAEGSDAFLASLKEIEEVYVGIPKLFFETQPVHPGCADAMAYALGVFGLPADALDLASMIGTTLSLCVPVNPVTRELITEEDESSAIDVEYDPIDWNPEEREFVDEVVRQATQIWYEVKEEVDEEFKPRDALGIVRHSYSNMERGMSALKKMLTRASESPEISRFLGRLVPDVSFPEARANRLIVDMVRFCITNVPDVMVGLLASKTVGNILVNLIPAIEIIDGKSFDMTIAGSFGEVDLGTILCNGIDFSIDGKDFDPQWVVCGLANAVGALMSCTSSPLDCTSIAASASNVPVIAPKCEKGIGEGENLVMPHPGGEGGPESVELTLAPSNEFYDSTTGDVNATTLANEGYIYFYDFRSTNFQAQFASQSGCAVSRVLDQFIPGWNRTAEIFVNEAASSMHEENNQDYLAFTTISRRGEACEWHIAQRGTFNQFEWVKNFQAELRPIPYDGFEDGLWHRGYGDLVATVGPMFDDYFSKFIGPDKECAYADSRIHMAGHSLGGGMVEAYSVHFAAVWQPLGVTIESVAFAPARALNPVAMAYVSERINMRSVVSHLDLVPRFPCANTHGLPRCDPRTCFTFNGEGWDTTYAQHPNELKINLDDLETLNATKFAHFDLNIKITATMSMDITMDIAAMPSHLDFALHHVDIYHCYFTRNYCTSEEKTLESACA